jgi:3-oxoacyl-[acyl-carrier-protein] synthase-3
VVAHSTGSGRPPRTASRAGGRPTTIKSLATYVPPRLLTNADLEKMVDTSDEWILKRTGIRERHRRSRRRHLGSRHRSRGPGDRESRADPGRHRLHRRRHGDARHVLSEHRLPDSGKIGARHAWGFDLSAACSAFTYSLTTASQFVASGARSTRWSSAPT